MQDSDEVLIRKMLAGEEAALAELYDRHQRSIYRFALHMSGSPAASEDITQEVFVTLIERASDFDPSRGSVGAFLFGIARNHLLRRLRSDRRIVAVEALEPEGMAPGNPLEDVSRQENVKTVRRIIVSLPPRYREAVVLCDLHEMDYASAGAILGCTTGTVRSRLHRGRQMLQQKLEARRRTSERNARGGACELPAF